MTKKNQIVKVNVKVTEKLQELKDKLDEIDVNVKVRAKTAYIGFYESRLKMELGQWTKGKAIFRYMVLRYGENYKDEGINYSKIARSIDRSDHSVKRWLKLYELHPDRESYRLVAETEATKWTKAFFKTTLEKLKCKQKQLPESKPKGNKMESHVKAIMNRLFTKGFTLTDELEELRNRLNKIHKKNKI